MSKNKNKVILREHSYDGIQEYDQKLPNWWLYTLYGAIIFSIGYWLYYSQERVSTSDVEKLAQDLARIETIRLANSIDVSNDQLFWTMSQNSDFILAGAKTYRQNCLACHGAALQGGIGVNLVDVEWIHGNRPSQIYHTIDQGVLSKGMQAWGPLLGQKKIAEVVAYILSLQDPQLLSPESVSP